MTQEEYLKSLDRLNAEHLEKCKQLAISYAMANNPYKVGEIFEDHLGKIIIESIGVSVYDKTPACTYYGLELKKDGTPRKDGSKRKAYQDNNINRQK